MKSMKFAHKLAQRFSPIPVAEEVATLIDNVSSLRGFNTPRELQSHLVEGALLNITKLASRALSVPCGDYMVWTTDAGHTMLVPVAADKTNNDVFEAHGKTYDIITKDLVHNWVSVEKVLAEELPPPTNSHDEPPSDHGGRGQMPGEMQDDQEGVQTTDDSDVPEGNQFKSRIDMSTVNRTPIVRAMQQHGYTVSSLANAVGVDPPAISRILRTPRDTQGDPGGRNPSIGLAARISNILKMDAEALFPDIFGTPKQDFHARETPGNRGSGMTNHAAGSRKKGKASDTWTQGGAGPQESIDFTVSAMRLANEDVTSEGYPAPTEKGQNGKPIKRRGTGGKPMRLPNGMLPPPPVPGQAHQNLIKSPPPPRRQAV